MPRRLDYPVFDADNHMYEPQGSLTKFLPKQYEGVIDYIEYKGRTKLLVRGQISNYIPNPTFSVVGSPGAQEDYFKSGAPEGATRKDIMKPMRAIPAFFDPAPRLELMDELGIDRATMYPTLASLIEERFRDDPDLTHVVIHALNQWILEHWTYNYEERIFPVPIITLPVVQKAIDELQYVVEHGAKIILIRPAPVPGYKGSRSFALPEFDPFWEAVVESGVLTVMHASDSGYTRYLNEWEGRSGEMEAFSDLGMFQASQMGYRAVEDAAISLLAHGCLHRHPGLKIAFVENGSSWVRPLLHHMETVWSRTKRRWPENPVDTFKRQVWVHPFHEDDPLGLISTLGADHVVFGSDYPHVEGLSDPLGYVDDLAGLPDEDVKKVMGANMLGLLGLGAAA